MLTEAHDSAGPVPVPPPVFYLLALGLGMGLDRWQPLPILALPGSVIMGNGLIALSMMILAWVLWQFFRKGTSFNVRRPASALITEGPYRFSRNPAYLCLTAVYVGLGIIANSVWIVALVLPVLWLMNTWVVPREERHLRCLFGATYSDYCERVRRWL